MLHLTTDHSRLHRLVLIRLAQETRLFLVALQFLTRLPVPSFDAFETSWLDRSAKYFPLAGLVVGAVTACILLAAAMLWTMPVAAVLAVGAGVVITGAFHEDGLADTADGLGGGLTRDRRLEIMKDSRIGTYGAAALGLTLALRVACLASLDPRAAALALVAAHTGARLAPLVMMRLTPYAGNADAAKAKPTATTLRAGELMFASAVALAVLIITLGLPAAICALLAAVTLAAVIARLAVRLIGGFTGDVLGCMEQMAEIGILLAAASAVRAVAFGV